jgi:3-hydroxyacyl-CoA dehydrogenase
LSDHDEVIGNKLAYILTGGAKAGLTKSVDEQYLLDIEREAFLSLAAEPLSQDRIRFMLKRGKPLRN